MVPDFEPDKTLSGQVFSTEAIRLKRPAVIRPEPGRLPLQSIEEWEAVDATGTPAHVTTIFLRGSECRFTCLMCDLWRYTHAQPTPSGAIPAQISEVLRSMEAPVGSDTTSQRWIKLYNASNFFDVQSIPAEDLSVVAPLLSRFDRVIVENHPCLLPWTRIETFQSQLQGQLEIAMGLETVQPEVLMRLNKRMRLEDFARAVDACHQHDVDVRAFVLLQLPWLTSAAAYEWCCRSIDYAVALGVRHVSVIPVRSGNGIIDSLAEQQIFQLPHAESLEMIMEKYLPCTDCLVTVDTWDWSKLAGLCDMCLLPRQQRMCQMNTSRKWSPPVDCESCYVRRS